MKRFLTGGLLIVVSVLCSGVAYAGNVAVSLFPASPLTLTTSPTDVSVNISGLGGFMDPTLGAYDVTLLFDPALISPGTPVFGTAGSDLLDPGDLCGAFCQVVTASSGSLEVAEVSLATDAQLQAIQPSSFTLFTVPFSVVGNLPSSAAITLQVNALADGNGQALSTVTSVPEPATWTLGAASLLALAFYRRRSKAS